MSETSSRASRRAFCLGSCTMNGFTARSGPVLRWTTPPPAALPAPPPPAAGGVGAATGAAVSLGAAEAAGAAGAAGGRDGVATCRGPVGLPTAGGMTGGAVQGRGGGGQGEAPPPPPPGARLGAPVLGRAAPHAPTARHGPRR